MLESAWETLWEPAYGRLLEVEAKWVPVTSLRVVDERTRVDMENVEVRISWGGPSLVPPLDQSGRVAHGETSPVQLPAPEWLDAEGTNERAWARAPGYGWESTVIGRERGGEYVIALRKGGDVRIEVSGVHAGVEPYFLLRDPVVEGSDGILFEDHLDGDAVIELASIPVGSYRGVLLLGHYYRKRLVLDEIDFTLRSGSTVDLHLDASFYVPPPLVEVHGELLISPEWELSRMGLSVELVDVPTIDGEADRFLPVERMELLDPYVVSYAWSFGELQPGSYEARFRPLDQSFAFQVPPEGMDPLTLEIPPPGVLEVSVVDDPSGLPVENVRVHWAPSDEGLQSGGRLSAAEPLGDGGRFELRAPQGELEIWCMSETHRFQRKFVTLTPGRQEVVVETPRAEGLIVRVLHGETALPLTYMELQLKEVDGEAKGWLASHSDANTRGHYVVTEPGLFRVEVTKLEGGYRLPDPVEVDVPASTFVELDLVVER